MQMFIAHAKENRPWVNWIQENVERVFPGTKLFVSPDNVKPGDPTWPATLQAIERSDAFIALISRYYLQSNAREEVGYAFRTAQQKGIRIIPVIIDSAVSESSHWPAMIQHLRPVDFSRDPQVAAQKLWGLLDQMNFQARVRAVVGGSILLITSLWLLSRR